VVRVDVGIEILMIACSLKLNVVALIDV